VHSCENRVCTVSALHNHPRTAQESGVLYSDISYIDKVFNYFF